MLATVTQLLTGVQRALGKGGFGGRGGLDRPRHLHTHAHTLTHTHTCTAGPHNTVDTVDTVDRTVADSCPPEELPVQAARALDGAEKFSWWPITPGFLLVSTATPDLVLQDHRKGLEPTVYYVIHHQIISHI